MAQSREGAQSRPDAEYGAERGRHVTVRWPPPPLVVVSLLNVAETVDGEAGGRHPPPLILLLASPEPAISPPTHLKLLSGGQTQSCSAY